MLEYIRTTNEPWTSMNFTACNTRRSLIWFIQIVAEAFRVEFDDGFGELSICDQIDFPIRGLSELKYAIDVWAKSGCYYLKVEFKQETSELITSEVTPIF